MSISPTNCRACTSTTLTELAGVKLVMSAKRSSSVRLSWKRSARTFSLLGGMGASHWGASVAVSWAVSTSVRSPRVPRE